MVYWLVHGCLVVVIWCGVKNVVLYYLDVGVGGGGLVSLDLIIGGSWFGSDEVVYRPKSVK